VLVLLLERGAVLHLGVADVLLDALELGDQLVLGRPDAARGAVEPLAHVDQEPQLFLDDRVDRGHPIPLSAFAGGRFPTCGFSQGVVAFAHPPPGGGATVRRADGVADTAIQDTTPGPILVFKATAPWRFLCPPVPHSCS